MVSFIIHYGLHFIAPIGLALLINPKQWKLTYLLFVAAMLIDLDHLFAHPIYDPNRCSIGFHPLHSYYAIGGYLALLLVKKSRLVGLALLWHIIADQIDCWI